MHFLFTYSSQVSCDSKMNPVNSTSTGTAAAYTLREVKWTENMTTQANTRLSFGGLTSPIAINTR